MVLKIVALNTAHEVDGFFKTFSAKCTFPSVLGGNTGPGEKARLF